MSELSGALGERALGSPLGPEGDAFVSGLGQEVRQGLCRLPVILLHL